jgi:phosphatidylinositol alpha 1,6-mannosyltransferase
VVGQRAVRRLGVPTVAVRQTDLAAFARQYGPRADLVVDRALGVRDLRPGRRSIAASRGRSGADATREVARA